MNKIKTNISTKKDKIINNVMNIMTQNIIYIFQIILLLMLGYIFYWVFHITETAESNFNALIEYLLQLSLQGQQEIETVKIILTENLEKLDFKFKNLLKEFKMDVNNIKPGEEPSLTYPKYTNTIIAIAGGVVIFIFIRYGSDIAGWAKGLITSMFSTGLAKGMTAIKQNQLQQLQYYQETLKSIQDQYLIIAANAESYHLREIVTIIEQRAATIASLQQILGPMYEAILANNVNLTLLLAITLAGGVNNVINMNKEELVNILAQKEALLKKIIEVENLIK